MGLFDLFKNKKQLRKEESLTYGVILDRAFKVFEKKEIEDIHAELLEIANGSLELAEQLYWFYPSILFKIVFPDVQNVDNNAYKVCYKDGTQKEFLCSDNELFCEILTYLKVRHTRLDREQTLNILLHSSEFAAVNNALNDGSKLEDLIVCTVYMSMQKNFSS